MEKPDIEIKSIDDMKVVYIRFKGTYVEFRKNSRKLFNKLFDYVNSKELIIPNVTKVLTMYNDNPFITEAKNLRTSFAMTVPNTITDTDSDEISVTSISGKFIVGHFNISPKEYEEAWQYMYHEYLFKSNEKPRDAIPFELYVTEPPKTMSGKSFTDIYIPIE